MYNAEREKLRNLFNINLADIQHVESTAVPRLKEKPTIDIMILVFDIDQVYKQNDKMEKKGYISKGEYCIRGRKYFVKTDGLFHLFHVHIYQYDDSANRYIIFRDYLRHSKEARAEYSSLKDNLAQEKPYDMKYYIQGKKRLG